MPSSVDIQGIFHPSHIPPLHNVVVRGLDIVLPLGEHVVTLLHETVPGGTVSPVP